MFLATSFILPVLVNNNRRHLGSITAHRVIWSGL